MSDLNTIIIGAGQSGVVTSYLLQRHRISHLVLEKQRAFSNWYRTWDSFRMNTANWMNAVPGAKHRFAPHRRRGERGDRGDVLTYFETYLRDVDPPLKEGLEVTGVQCSGGQWRVETPESDYVARNVVVCTGQAQTPKVPGIASELPESVEQIHSAEYRRPSQITTRRVLVVGSGSSGSQICAELADSGRFDEVVLAASGNKVIPWTKFGVSMNLIVAALGMYRVSRHSMIGKRMYADVVKHGQPSTPPSPATLARVHRVRVVGRAGKLREQVILCSDGSEVATHDLTIIWATGFRASFDYISCPGPIPLDEWGEPAVRDGHVRGVPGLYMLGQHFQETASSHLIHGIGRDAIKVANSIKSRAPRCHEV